MPKIFLAFLIVFSLFNISALHVSAQVQSGTFGGSNPESYQCFDENSNLITEPGPVDARGIATQQAVVPTGPDANGNFYCNVNGKQYLAVLKPVTLQQVEIWFVRVLYAIWALVGALSFLAIVWFAYNYLLRAGTSDAELVKLRKFLLNFSIGFALVFLSYPILTTFFRVLSIDESVDCYNVNMPGFQFFFTELCTDPKNIIQNNPCSITFDADGVACRADQVNSTASCTDVGQVGNPNFGRAFRCTTGQIWEVTQVITNSITLNSSQICNLNLNLTADGFRCTTLREVRSCSNTTIQGGRTYECFQTGGSALVWRRI